jgi:hypothetical protein
MRSGTCRKSTSLAAQAKALARRYFYTPPGCKLSTDKWYTQAGQQTMISDRQKCAAGNMVPCTLNIQKAFTYSTTVTSETTTQFQTTQCIILSMSAEVGLPIVKMTYGAEFTVQFSEAVTQATGQQVMDGQTTTLSYTMPVILGNYRALTFTPLYNCTVGPLDCGYQPSQPLTVCQPILGSDNKTIIGDYSVVTFG